MRRSTARYFGRLNQRSPHQHWGSTAYLRRRLAVGAYRVDGDRVAAVDRLNVLTAELQESTPSEQIDGLADLAIAFAAVGDIARAKQLLATVPEQCLGYALAPKKDPQYAIWRDILVLANNSDPESRIKRVSNLMRQVGGMSRNGRVVGRASPDDVAH